MTLEQRVAVLEEIFAKLQDYYTSAYSGEEIDARLASAGVPIGITKEYKSVAEMNQDFTGTDVQRGQFVLILPDSTASADYGKVYLKGTANWVYTFTLTTLTSIKGPIGPPGKKGDQGDPGEAGSSFAILGYFDTLDALKAAVPNPKAGDVYGVGTAPPYNIYIWDTVHGKWVPNGNLQGPPGEQGIQGPEGNQGPEGKQGPEGPVGGSGNFVRYDEAQELTDEQKTQARTNIGADTVQGAVLYTPQTLTDEQKAQARENINAAPGGFGLGGGPKQISSWDDVRDNGWYYGPAPAGIGNGNLWGRVDALSSTYAVQTIYSDTYVASAKRFLIANAWKTWEWVNPPMTLGVEYRTTERYFGKPVYAKTFNIPVSVFENQLPSYSHGIDHLDRIVDARVYCRADWIRPLPWSYYGSAEWSAQYMLNSTLIKFEIGSNALARIKEYTNGVDVTLKYTKTTD